MIVTDRIRRMREGNVFLLSTPGGVPEPSPAGGGGGVIEPGPAGGVPEPGPAGGGYPSQVQPGGTRARSSQGGVPESGPARWVP